MKQPIKKSRAEANGISNKETIYRLVVDGNNLLKISLVDKTMNSKGQEYGAVVSFLRILGTILNKKDFNFCVVCWDGLGSGVLRWKLYEDYKANRDKHYALHDPELSDYDKKLIAYQKMVLDYSRHKNAQRNKEHDRNKELDEESFERQKCIIRNILEELCVRQYEFENVEGDDIISYCVKNRQSNEKVVIVSSDKDLTQLICEDVIVYNPRMKEFVTKDNSVEKIGITHENVVLEKILCGDVSDNIKGVKGIGEQTLMKLFPQIKTDKMDLEAVIELSKELLRERKEQKKKPLKSLENIVNGITDGCQGDKLYEINKKIIDLSEPMMTDEAVEELSEVLYAPIDTSDRDMKNVYRIVNENEMNQLYDEGKFGEIFSPYSRIIMMEKRRYQNFLKKS